MHNMKDKLKLLKRQSIFGLSWNFDDYNFDDYIHVHDYNIYKKYRNFILIKEKYKTSYYFMLFIDGEIYKITNEEDIEDILQIHFKNEIRKDKLNKLNYEK